MLSSIIATIPLHKRQFFLEMFIDIHPYNICAKIQDSRLKVLLGITDPICKEYIKKTLWRAITQQNNENSKIKKNYLLVTHKSSAMQKFERSTLNDVVRRSEAKTYLIIFTKNI